MRCPLVVAALAIAVGGAAVHPDVAKSAPVPRRVVIKDCREHAVIVPGVERRIRQRVPPQFELVRDPLGRPLVVVAGSRCRHYEIDDRSWPTTFGVFAALIQSPDGGGCLTQLPVIGPLNGDLVPLCNVYNFFAVYNRRPVARALRRRFRDAPIRYVRRLSFRRGDFDTARMGEPFHYRAGGRTPSRFTLDAIVRDGVTGGPVSISFWLSVASGTAGGRFDITDFTPGQMDVTLRAAPGSGMARLLGTEKPTPLASLPYHYPRAEGVYLGHGP